MKIIRTDYQFRILYLAKTGLFNELHKRADFYILA